DDGFPTLSSRVMCSTRVLFVLDRRACAILIPIGRRKVAARRRRPESLFAAVGQFLDLRSTSLTKLERAPRRFEAVPVHFVLVAMNERSAVATRSLSSTVLMASSRLPP